jgi:hypothetical protein
LRRPRTNLRRVTLGALTILISGACLAHHSGALWDTSKTETLEGTVKQFQWNNPHCWIQLLVAGDTTGTTQEWSIEMAAPIQVLQGGWKPSTLKSGDRVQVRLHPARDGSHSGNFVSALRADGQPIGKAQQEHRP